MHTCSGPIMLCMTSTSPPRRLSIDSHASDRRLEIRSVAANLFLEAGFSGTTMNDIAEAAGILPGSLYHHFASKEEIAVELITAYTEDLTKLTRTTLSTATVGTPERRLRDLATHAAELSMHHAAAHRLRSYQPPTSATERLTAVINFEDPELIESWRSVVEAAVASAVPPVDAALLRFSLAYLMFGSGTAYPPGTDVRPIANQACDLLLHGLAMTAPTDAQLDASEPMQVALGTIAKWSTPEPEGSDTRTRILAAARSEFARRGYAATTIRDIAELAEVRMGTLYRRISSKEAILAEVLEGHSQELTTGTEAVLGAGGTPVEKLDAIAYFQIRASRHFHDEAQILKFGWNGSESSGPFRTYYQEAQRRLSLIENVIAQGLESDVFRPIGTAPEIAVLMRRVLWMPFQTFENASFERTQTFIRRSFLHSVLP